VAKERLRAQKKEKAITNIQTASGIHGVNGVR